MKKWFQVSSISLLSNSLLPVSSCEGCPVYHFWDWLEATCSQIPGWRRVSLSGSIHVLASHWRKYSLWRFPKMKVPQNGWFLMENPTQVDDWGVPPWKSPYIGGDYQVPHAHLPSDVAQLRWQAGSWTNCMESRCNGSMRSRHRTCWGFLGLVNLPWKSSDGQWLMAKGWWLVVNG